ncbi:MAG: Rieske 2Fe-2S domain-containing protein, partial [Bacilli bacterium]|nr:Rieske 2Fe-2S domain-containing protein [Bacilli bacterium]
KDLMAKKSTDFEVLLRPKRLKFTKKLLTYNLGMVKTLLKTRAIPHAKTIILAKEEGRVLKIDNKRIGVYKDQDNKLHFVDATCPHLRCGLRFNLLEKTYDCNCHGSRFSYTGKLLDGPSLRDLDKIDISKVTNFLP